MPSIDKNVPLRKGGLLVDDLRSAIANITKTITKTSSGLVKSTKLNMDLAAEEANLKDAYVKIGRKVCEIYEYGGSLGKHFDEEYAAVKEIESRLDRLREEVDIAKGTKTCTKCGKSAPRTSEFCPSCGAPMGDVPVNEPEATISVVPDAVTKPAAPEQAPVPEPAAMPETEQFKICPLCGGKNNKNDKFCLSCGRAI